MLEAKTVGTAVLVALSVSSGSQILNAQGTPSAEQR